MLGFPGFLIYIDNYIAAYDLCSRRYFKIFIVVTCSALASCISLKPRSSVAAHMDHEMRGFS